MASHLAHFQAKTENSKKADKSNSTRSTNYLQKTSANRAIQNFNGSNLDFANSPIYPKQPQPKVARQHNDLYEYGTERVVEGITSEQGPAVTENDKTIEVRGDASKHVNSKAINSSIIYNRSYSKIPFTNTDAIQLQTDVTPPENIWDRLKEAEKFLEEPSIGQEIPDMGEGISSAERIPPSVPEKSKDEETETSVMQTKLSGQPIHQDDVISPPSILLKLGNGSPINSEMTNTMGEFYNESLEGVKFYTDYKANNIAQSLNAHAFTMGDNIAFAKGRYQPDTREGRRLIAHELTHVLQQRKGLSGNILQEGIGCPGDRYEVEADDVAEKFIDQEGTSFKKKSYNIRPSILSKQGQKVQKSIIQMYSGSTAATYAQTWALSTNPKYGRFSNDCTNFVSQAVLDGGWSMIGGSFWDRKQDNVWWYGKSWAATASYTWGGAHNFSKFLGVSGRGSSAAHVMDLGIGDVLQIDFSGGGHIGHTMIVTKKDPTNLYLSYHTADHLDEPFYGSKGILSRIPDPPAKYYAWKL